jgi:3-isopropylmalate/(R)-2-methylmalate dehydratase large subunit
MSMTLAEKLIANAAGLETVSPGDIVTCQVDLAMMHDSSGPRRVQPMLDRLGAPIWDPSKVVLISDHFTPATDPASAAILDLTRTWAQRNGVENFYDMEGICHIMLPERGHLRPGMFAVGADSHSTTGGAFGAFMIGIGATELAGVLVSGEIWVRVPATIRIAWTGRLMPGVAAKDMMLSLCGSLGMSGANYRAVEYTGSAVQALSMAERMVLSNMAAELGAKAGLVAPDEVTIAALQKTGVQITEPDAAKWRGDEEAEVEATHIFDADGLAPQVAAPHSPANAAAVDTYTDVAIDRAYIGACTGAKREDLRMAADVLRGRTVAGNTRLVVVPASRQTIDGAKADGSLAVLEDAGAEFLGTGCGACAGYGAGQLDEGEVCISTTARNFQGRMGAPSSQVYLASPYTVAASALAGRIADPRGFLARRH